MDYLPSLEKKQERLIQSLLDYLESLQALLSPVLSHQEPCLNSLIPRLESIHDTLSTISEELEEMQKTLLRSS